MADNLILPERKENLCLQVYLFREHISACFYFKWAAPTDRRLYESDDMGVGTCIILDTQMYGSNAFISNLSRYMIHIGNAISAVPVLP